MGGSTGQPKLHLMEVAALVVGYGLASMLVRAYWPATTTPSAWELVFIAVVFGWLGLAMSGPMVLLARRPPRPPSPDDADAQHPAAPRSWSELAWLIIGFYWIVLTLIVVPTRLRGAATLDSAFLGIFPVLVALGIRFFGPPALRRPADETGWSHRAGVGLLVTWPFAWFALIVLGKTLL